MFAGPGSGPLIAAATAWGELAEELLASIASLGSVTSELTSGAWLGPSAAAMMAVATQYLAWLSTAAAQAEQAAAQAMAIATAFEAALAATVQPAVVAANRGLMQLLAATNWFGQNAPALMDVEAAYEQMWALDVAAMAGYHFDASAAVAQLAPWQQVLRNLGIDIGKNGQINLGFGNTGSGNIGIGNSGSLNSGIGTSGTINAGLGSAGSLNTSFWNAGMQNAALGSAAGSEAALVSSAGYATGGMSTAALSSGILASALGSTGGLQHGLANVLNSGLTNTPVAAPASAPVGGLDSGNRTPLAAVPRLARAQTRALEALAPATRASSTRAATTRACGIPPCVSRVPPAPASPSRTSTRAPTANPPTPARGSGSRSVRSNTSGAYPRIRGCQKGRPQTAGRRLARLPVRLPDHRR